MYTTAFLTTLLAALATAAPATNINARDDTYYGIGISIRTTDAFTQPPVYEPSPVQLNVLTTLYKTSASEIKFDIGATTSNVDVNSVECRAYKDAAGVVPGSAPFTAKTPAELSTNLVEVGSVLCYIVTEAERV